MTGTSTRNGATRRAAILDGAVEVFAELGYAGASLRELAAGADMQKGHLTYYFPTKDDLLFEVVDDLHERFLSGFTSWTKEEPAHDQEGLRHLFRRHLELVFDRHLQTRVAYDNLQFLSPERRDVIRSKRTRYERRLARKISACRANGVAVVDEPGTLLTKTVLGVLNWPYKWYSPGGRRPADDLAERLAARALAAIQPLVG